MALLSLNTFLIIVLFYIILFTGYVLKIYFNTRKTKSRKNNPIPNTIILGVLILLISYIIILSYLIKIPSYKSFYMYECFPVKYIPLPLLNESRCSKIILFNLTFPLEPNRVLYVKPDKLLNNYSISFNENHGAYLGKNTNFDNCILEPGTAFFYYCMEYDTRDSNLYFMNVKNDLPKINEIFENK